MQVVRRSPGFAAILGGVFFLLYLIGGVQASQKIGEDSSILGT